MPGRKSRRKLVVVRTLFSIVFSIVGLFFLANLRSPAQAAVPQSLSASQAQALVDRALANELRAALDAGRPMRYVLKRSTPRLSSTREIYETREGDVARLLAIDGRPLGPAAEQKEEARLSELAATPGRQRHRQQAEDADRARALKVLRALPEAFLYEYAGTEQGPGGLVEKFAFRPNPEFSPTALETQALTAMAGAIWIDPRQERVTRLEGHLQQDVNFGWGILGRLNKGGWIVIDQAEVLPGQWRTVRLQMAMNGRVFFRSRNFDTTEEESQFALLPPAMGYQQAIAKLESGASAPAPDSR